MKARGSSTGSSWALDARHRARYPIPSCRLAMAWVPPCMFQPRGLQAWVCSALEGWQGCPCYGCWCQKDYVEKALGVDIAYGVARFDRRVAWEHALGVTAHEDAGPTASGLCCDFGVASNWAVAGGEQAQVAGKFSKSEWAVRLGRRQAPWMLWEEIGYEQVRVSFPSSPSSDGLWLVHRWE